jgi:RNA polymerase sigma factor (sigma-70 family)
LTDDRQLLDDYVGHRSQEAFAELVQRHLSLVYFTALRRVGNNRALAEDVAQTVFIALARKAAEVRRRPALAGWLYTSARFAAAQAVRAERRRARREQEAQALQMIDASASPEESPSPLIDDALDRLSDVDREMVLLRFQEARGFGEVGARYELSADGARRRIERALDRMRRVLERRGITSTAAALGSALASRAALVAPAALAPGIVSAAFTGAAAAGWTAAGWQAAAGAAGWKLAAGVAALAVVGGGFAAWRVAERTRAAEEMTPAAAVENGGAAQAAAPALPAESPAAPGRRVATAGEHRGHYTPARVQLANLEEVVTTLTQAQRAQVLRIYQNLADIMDSLDPATRPEAGAASRESAWRAVRALLNPEQRKLYDAHRMGFRWAPTWARSAVPSKPR